ncbi:LacI family DNA-binding transcriptional regulator [Pseudarthrobacter sp. B4EP4b]|uniref:LacI family DNA-binding transcriptional regulator n=1 Tax=Pseudarthrobacter sp. B4EP4b TaxID=2590664 RepID=UPI001150DF94|nr:LacI family DNA-binding transcriptional regulator [Pseudarthrobacter sp. B4EP4b]
MDGRPHVFAQAFSRGHKGPRLNGSRIWSEVGDYAGLERNQQSMPAVTLNDVAIAAGVSVGTASRAMTGRGRVSAETIEHVRAVASGLGYKPNVIGQALRRGSSNTVGMVVPHIENPFFAELIRAVESGLHDKGYQLIVADSHADTEAEERRLGLLLARQVDGILVVPACYGQSAAAVVATAGEVPLVQLDRRAGEDTADYVGVDNRAGMTLIAEHLAAQGVRTVQFVGGDDATSPGTERAEAFQEIAATVGLDLVGIFRHQFTYETGTQAMSIQDPIPDAIVCGDDLIALGAYGQLRRAGVDVPGRTKVTGFDGTVLSTIVEPSLTTIKQPLEQISNAAIEALVRRMRGHIRPTFVNEQFEPRLQTGGTTQLLPGNTTALA